MSVNVFSSLSSATSSTMTLIIVMSPSKLTIGCGFVFITALQPLSLDSHVENLLLDITILIKSLAVLVQWLTVSVCRPGLAFMMYSM
jgi:hypothetical protein